MGPIKDIQVLNAFSKSLALRILKSEMWVLVTTSNVNNPEGNKKCPDKALYCDLRIHRDMCGFALYFGNL